MALWVVAIAALNAVADAPTDSTWVPLGSLPHQGRAALFALAVDSSNNQVLVAGNSEGSLLRSPNAGTTWTTVHTGKASFTAINFSPFTPGLVLAGTRGSGALSSRDGGVTWNATAGLEGRTVRVFAFALTLVAAGTDRGVFVSNDGLTWAQSGLSDHSIDALAVEAIHAPVRLVAGSDAQTAGGILPLYQSVDGGASWTQFNPPLSGTIAVKLAAGPLPPTGNIRPLIVATNTGLFASSDNGASFNALSGGGLLPTTDYTQVNFITDHYNRFYAGSDGGGSMSGGLWRTDDGGQTFTSLEPPERSITALAVSNDEQPTLYVAAFRPSTHVASLWVYHDTFGTPRGPAVSASPASSGSRTSHPGKDSSLSAFLASPELPFIALGLGALVIILAAIVSHLRGRAR